MPVGYPADDAQVPDQIVNQWKISHNFLSDSSRPGIPLMTLHTLGPWTLVNESDFKSRIEISDCQIRQAARRRGLSGNCCRRENIL